MAQNTTNADYVSTGAPKIGGYAYKAPEGSTLPTNATDELASTYKNLGFISDSGVVNSNSPETEDVRDWGGTVVASTQSAKADTWKFTLIESKNTEVLKTVYGDENVTGTLETGIAIKANDKELEYATYVFEMVMKNKTKKRIVIPSAKVTSVGDITYGRSGVVGYEVTLTCRPCAAGDTHYEYIKAETPEVAV